MSWGAWCRVQVWLDSGSTSSAGHNQLPTILQVLLSPSDRARAIALLARFMDLSTRNVHEVRRARGGSAGVCRRARALGRWRAEAAVRAQVLDVHMFPYAQKLIKPGTPELTHVLSFVWAKILALDETAQADIVAGGRYACLVSPISCYHTQHGQVQAVY